MPSMSPAPASTSVPSSSPPTPAWAFTPPTAILFCIITGPVGAYYAEGINPVKIYVENEDVRAVKGGTGYTKCGGNYAASIRAGERAGAERLRPGALAGRRPPRSIIEEVGSMNVMFQVDGETVHPRMLTGSVLPGITRKLLPRAAEELGARRWRSGSSPPRSSLSVGPGRHAGRGLGHWHRRRHLPHRRDGLGGPARGGQRRQDRPPGPAPV
ncbi:MAG: hypothetical protein ACLRWQ_23280 [Flavonifractor plautii]